MPTEGHDIQPKPHFQLLLLLSLLAAYLPGLVWLLFVPGVSNPVVAYFLSPVMFMLVSSSITSVAGIFGVMTLFFVAILVLSAMLCRFRWAMVLLPCFLLMASAYQGVLAVIVLRGLHSVR